MVVLVQEIVVVIVVELLLFDTHLLLRRFAYYYLLLIDSRCVLLRSYSGVKKKGIPVISLDFCEAPARTHRHVFYTS